MSIGDIFKVILKLFNFKEKRDRRKDRGEKIDAIRGFDDFERGERDD